MLSSWLGQNSNEEGTVEGPTPRQSLSSPAETQQPRPSTERPKRVFPNAFTTPHDSILSDLKAPGSRPGATDVPNRPASTRGDQVISPDLPESVDGGAREDAELNLARAEGNTRSPTPPSNFASSRPSSADMLLDPFDGSVVGVLLPRQDDATSTYDLSPSQANLPGFLDAAPSGSDAVWTHLSRILELQSQISKQHLEMESIGTAKGNDGKRKGHKHPESKGGNEATTTPSADNPDINSDDPRVPPGLRPRQRAMSTVSTLSTNGESEGDEEGVNVPSEEAEKHRIREEEFAKLSTQFEGRKEAINDIMSKLNDLSKALSEFHNIPSPNIEFPASRNNSAGVTSPSASTTSPKPPAKEAGMYLRPPSSHSATAKTSRTYEWTKQTAASSSSTLRPPQSHSRDRTEPVILSPSPPKVAPPKPAPPKKIVPPILVDSVDGQSPVHDSPASTLGSLHLSPE